MAPTPIWLDTNILVNIRNGRRATASAAEKALGRSFEAEIINLQKDGYELLISPRVKFELLQGNQAQAGLDVLNSLPIKEDGLVIRVPRQQVWAWGQEGIKHGLSAHDADVIAQVRAGAQARGIRSGVFFTRDAGGTLRAMRNRGVLAIEFKTGMPRPKPAMPKPPTPRPPSVGPELPSGSARWGTIKAGLKAGLKDVFSAENIAAMIPDLLLAFADRMAAREAVRKIETNFIKEGFARGVSAGVMGWTEQEVQLNLKNRITPFRVQGLEDPAGILPRAYILKLSEAYENYAVDVGYQFSSQKPLGWKRDMLNKGMPVLQRYGYHFGTDPGALFEYEFLDKLAWVLRPATDSLVEPAIRRN